MIRLTDWDGNVTASLTTKPTDTFAPSRSNTLDSLYQHDAAGRLRSLHHLVGAADIRQSFLYAVDSRGNRTQAREVTPRTSGATATTMDHNYAGLVYRGDWDAVGSYHEANAHDASVSMLFYGDTATLTMGSGDDHSIFDVYIDGTLWQSFDGYAGTPGDLAPISISVEGTGLHLLEIKNRLEHRIGSSGYKLRFKSLYAQPAFDVSTIDYTYDSLSRLLTANYDGGAVEYTYGYDLAGNLVNNNGTTRTYNAANQMVNDGTNTLTYDANGNLTNDGVNAYTWDRANRMLTAPGSTSYVYDGSGNRIQQTVSSVITDYLLDTQPGLAVVLRQDDGTNVDHFVHTGRGIHAAYDGTNWEYAIQDGLRSVRGWADSNADVNNPVSFDPYGEPDTSVDGFAFTGEMRDGNGLQYHRARYYKPGAGVWMAQDFLETANRYGYVRGNPSSRVDPTGLFDWSTGTVEQGDRIWCIAREGTAGWNGNNPPSNTEVGQTASKLCGHDSANPHIRNCNLIHPGDVLNIPEHIRLIGLRNADKSCHENRVINLNVQGIPEIPCPPDTLREREPIVDSPPPEPPINYSIREYADALNLCMRDPQSCHRLRLPHVVACEETLGGYKRIPDSQTDAIAMVFNYAAKKHPEDNGRQLILRVTGELFGLPTSLASDVTPLANTVLFASEGLTNVFDDATEFLTYDSGPLSGFSTSYQQAHQDENGNIIIPSGNQAQHFLFNLGLHASDPTGGLAGYLGDIAHNECTQGTGTLEDARLSTAAWIFSSFVANMPGGIVGCLSKFYLAEEFTGSLAPWYRDPRCAWLRERNRNSSP